MGLDTHIDLSRVVRKLAFCICESKDAISFAVTAKLISAFVFAIRIVQSLYYINPKFQASSNLLWPYSLVCVGPGRKPRRPVFSQRGSSYVYEKKFHLFRLASQIWKDYVTFSFLFGRRLLYLLPTEDNCILQELC